MAGTPKYISIDTTRFSIPADCKPLVNDGGRVHTESEVYCDGKTKAVESVVPAKISGIVVDTADGKWEILKALKTKKDIPVVYQSATKAYELTGSMICPDGLENDSVTDKSKEFEIHASDGVIRST